MTTREIHALGATRWTSTSTAPAHRAPFGGRGGLSGCGCGRCAGCAGLGAVAPITQPASGVAAQLTVKNHVLSQGAYDPARMVAAIASALAAQGLRAPAPKIGTYPLLWAWDFDAPNKVYQARIIGSNPFVAAYEGQGPTSPSAPTGSA